MFEIILIIKLTCALKQCTLCKTFFAVLKMTVTIHNNPSVLLLQIY